MTTNEPAPVPSRPVQHHAAQPGNGSPLTMLQVFGIITLSVRDAALTNRTEYLTDNIALQFGAASPYCKAFFVKGVAYAEAD